VSIAYQVVGEGPFDVVRIPGWMSHVELAWTTPQFDMILGHDSSYCRLTRFRFPTHPSGTSSAG
jgi:hypothetical protein